MKYFFVFIIMILLTANSRAQWEYQEHITNEKLQTVFFIDSLYGWIGGANGLILNTTDGGDNWTINSDSSRGAIRSFSFINRLIGWVVTDSGNMLKTLDGGNTWIQKHMFDTFLYKVLFLNKNLGFVVANPTNISEPIALYKTINGGDNWTPIAIPDLTIATDIEFFNENQGYIVGGFPAKILETNDGGTNWNLLKSDSSIAWFNTLDFNDIENGFIGGFVHSSFYNPLFKTTNKCQNWNKIPLFTENYSSIIYRTNKIWIIINNNTILHSFDNATTWLTETSTLMSQGILDMVFITDNLGWAVGNFGSILKTVNGGYDTLFLPQQPILKYPPNNFNFSTNVVEVSWNNLESSLANIEIAKDTSFLNIIASNLVHNEYYTNVLPPEQKYYLRIRSENPLGVSIWSDIRTFTVGNLVDVKDDATKPTHFSLEQNYPNPFNPITQITYQIPKDGFVNLVVYNTLGQVVSELVNEHQTSGKYSVQFNATGLSSGVYFYRINTNDFVQIKKMILLR